MKWAWAACLAMGCTPAVHPELEDFDAFDIEVREAAQERLASYGERTLRRLLAGRLSDEARARIEDTRRSIEEKRRDDAFTRSVRAEMRGGRIKFHADLPVGCVGRPEFRVVNADLAGRLTVEVQVRLATSVAEVRLPWDGTEVGFDEWVLSRGLRTGLGLGIEAAGSSVGRLVDRIREAYIVDRDGRRLRATSVRQTVNTGCWSQGGLPYLYLECRSLGRSGPESVVFLIVQTWTERTYTVEVQAR